MERVQIINGLYKGREGEFKGNAYDDDMILKRIDIGDEEVYVQPNWVREVE